MVPIGCASWGSAAIVASTATGSAAGGGAGGRGRLLGMQWGPAQLGLRAWAAACTHDPRRQCAAKRRLPWRLHPLPPGPHPSAASLPPSSAAAGRCWAGCHKPPGRTPAGEEGEGSRRQGGQLRAPCAALGARALQGKAEPGTAAAAADGDSGRPSPSQSQSTVRTKNPQERFGRPVPPAPPGTRLEEVGALRQLLNGVAAVAQDAPVPVDV